MILNPRKNLHRLTNPLHQWLFLKSKVYASWHQNRYYSKVHFAVLLGIICCFAFIFSQYITVTPPQRASAAGITKYARTAGGNWSADATWSTTSGGAADTVKPTAEDDVIFDANSGNVTIDAAVTAKTLTQTGYLSTLTHNQVEVTMAGNVTLEAGRYTAVGPLSSFISGNSAACLMTTGGNAIGRLRTSTGVMTLGDNVTFIADQSSSIVMLANTLNLNGKTVSGNSLINRLLVQSSVIGTARTITVSGGTFANVDFQDITFANGGADLDLSAITGGSGDCGGNSMSGGGALTLTPADDWYWHADSGSWSDNTKWFTATNGGGTRMDSDARGAYVILPQDTPVFDSSSIDSGSQTLTIDIPRLPATNFSAVTNNPAVTMSTTGLTYSWYGSAVNANINLTGVGTFTSTMYAFIISRTNVTITSNGKTFGTNYFKVYIPGATLTLADAFVNSGNVILYLGTLTTNSTVTVNRYEGDPGTTTNMGSGTWTFSGGGTWTMYMLGSVNCGTSTIALTYTGANATTFVGGTNTYNNITIAPGSGVLTFSGAFTFANMTMSSAGVKTIKFTEGTTYTMTGTNFLSGTDGFPVTISSVTPGSAFTLSRSSGTVTSDWISLQDSIASGGTWNATHSYGVSGNSGWNIKRSAVKAGGNWSAAATWFGDATGSRTNVPLATDDIYLDSVSGTSAPVVIDATAVAKSLDCTGFTHTLTHNTAITLTVSGSLTFVSGMTYTPADDTAAITMNDTGTLTTGTKTVGNLTFNGSGKTFTIVDNLSTRAATTTVTLTQGTLKTDGASDNSGLTHSWGIFTPANSASASLKLGASNITIASNFGAASVTAWILDAGTSVLTFTGGSTSAFTPGGNKTYYDVVMNSAGGTGIANASYTTTMRNFTRTGTAVKTDTFSITGNIVVTGKLSLIGNSATNRLMVQSRSDTIGIQRRITVTGTSGNVYQNVDFQDIDIFDSAGQVDLSGIAGGSGNCGGNNTTDMKFTLADDWYWHVDSGSWSDNTKWYTETNGGGTRMDADPRGAYVMLPQDTAVFDANSISSASQTITIDMPRLPATNFSAVTNTPTVLMSTTGLTYSWYGSANNTQINLTGVGTFTNSKQTFFMSRINMSLTSAGKTFGSFNEIYMVGSTLTFQDAFIGGQYINLVNGTLTTNSNVACTRVIIGTGTTVNMGGGTWSLSVASATIATWAAYGTVNAGTSTIAYTNTSATASSFTGGTNTYNNITIAPGSGVLTFSGAFIFANMTMASAGTKTVKFTKSTTYTMTGMSFLSGTSGNLVTIDSDDGATAFTMNKTSGTIITDYVAKSRMIVGGGAVWYSTANSTPYPDPNTSGNTGWTASGGGNIRTASSAGGNWSATGTWNEASVPTSSDYVYFIPSSGNVTIDAAATAKTLTQTGYTNVLTHTDAITCTVSGSVTLLTGKYVASGNTARIYIVTSATLTTGGNGIGSFLNASGTVTLGDNYTGWAGPSVSMQTAVGATINLNGKTVSGSSSTNRLLVRSYTIGSTSNITVSGGTFANADFQDIAFANGGANLDLSAITGLSGDCGGNSMSGGGTLTMTSAVKQYWQNVAGGSWSTAANWTSRVPLPQDDVDLGNTADATPITYNSGVTVTADMPRLGKSISWAGATWTGTATTWDQRSIDLTSYGGLALISGMTVSSVYPRVYTLSGRSSFVIVSNTTSSNRLYRLWIDTSGGTYTLADAITVGHSIAVYRGNFNTAGYNVTTYYGFISNGSYARSVNITNSTITATFYATGYGWVIADTGLTLTTTGSTIALAHGGATTFTGGSQIYNNITIAPGSGVLTFSGAFTFANMTMSSAGTKTVKFTKSTTYTMTGTSFLNGTAGNLVTIDSDDSATAFTMNKTSGTIITDYVAKSRMIVGGGAVWYSTANSTPYPDPNTSGNTGWTASGSGNIRTASAAGGNWSATSTWNEAAVPTSANDVYFITGSGNVTVDATSNFKTLTQQISYNNILTISSGFALRGYGNATFLNNKLDASNGTYSQNDTGTLTTGGNRFRTLSMGNSNKVLTLDDDLLFTNNITAAITIANTDSINLNGHTLSGYSSTSRVLVSSSTIGTPVTVNVSGGTFAYADFQDITFANGGSNLDLSAITGGSGDCGGNSMSGGGTLTFTTAAPQTWTNAAGGNWSTSGNWTSRVPLPQDDVNMGVSYSAGVTVIADMTRLGKSIDWTGATNSPTFRKVNTFYIYGSLSFISGMSFTNPVGTNDVIMAGRGANIIISAGKNILNANFRFQAPGGSLDMADNLLVSGGYIYIDDGIFRSNGYNITSAYFNSSNSNTRTINITGSLFTVTGGGGTVFSMGTITNLTFISTGSTIAMTYSGASANAFSAGPNIYNNITIAPSPAVLTFSGAFTFANMTMASSGTKTIKFTKNTTYTMTGSNFLNGSATGAVTIDSDDGATQFTLSKASGIVNVDYASVSRAKITGAGKWYLTQNSTPQPDPNINGNEGWSVDTTAPSNPTTTTANVDGTNIVDSSWINQAGNINFQFSGAADADSGVLGYYTYFGIDPAANPATYQAHSGAIGDTQVTSTSTTTADDGKHFYFRVKTKDAVGNISAAATLFNFAYDITLPTRPTFVAANPAGYTTVNSFVFTWPAGTDPNGPGGGASGIKWYEYKRATDGSWSHTADAATRSVADIEAYQEGANAFYVRTADIAGNFSSDYQQVTYYWSGTAPAKPNNLAVNPDTNDENSFTIEWDKPAVAGGDPPIVAYLYSINAEPTVSNTTRVVSIDNHVTLGPSPFATQQGTNTIYMVSEDAAGNKSFETAFVATASFNCQTPAPPTPISVTISDSSNRAIDLWALTITWLPGVGYNANIFDHYLIQRSTDGFNFSDLATTTSLAYIDTQDISNEYTYLYRIFEVDTADKESVASSTVLLKPRGNYTVAPTLLNTPQSLATSNSATISWDTDRVSTSFVRYGTSSGALLDSNGQIDLTQSHEVILSGLSGSTTYYFQVQSADNNRDYSLESAYSSSYTFTTLAPPTVSTVRVDNVTLASADISFETTTVASSRIDYGKTSAYGNTIDDSSGAATTTHQIKIVGLDHSSQYHFKITSTDVNGNLILSDDYSFETLPMPEIENATITEIKDQPGQMVKVTWTTNVPATSIVKYQTEGAEEQESVKSALSTDHEIILNDLVDSSKYTITIQSRDQFGNLAEEAPLSYQTSNDKRPPKISNIIIETSNVGYDKVEKAQIIISWKTDEFSSSKVDYGTNVAGEYTLSSGEDQTLTRDHQVIVSDLTPGAVVHLKVSSSDKSGNIANSGDNVAITGESRKSVLQLIINIINRIFGGIIKL